MLAFDWIGLGAAQSVPGRPYAGEERQRSLSIQSEPVGVLRGFVSAYSQKDVNGTTQRCSVLSQARQCGLAVLRMFVIGAPPNCGGPGMPQRASMSSLTPSGPLRTIGAA
jgi:hypothetical protein